LFWSFSVKSGALVPTSGAIAYFSSTCGH
jgi:hypothetical protein